MKNYFLKRSNFKVFFIFVFFMCSAAQITSAQSSLKGTVKDKEGLLLPGANITITGTPVGAQTDFDGNFVLVIPPNTKSITFSYLGYKSKVITYNGQKELNVVLLEDRSQLDEIIVVGYGTQRAKDVTGAITKVKTEAIERTTNQTIEQALSGRIAGLNAVSSDGSLGAGVRIRVRGGTSVAGTNEPLYVIDGLPVEADYDINNVNSGIEDVQSSPIANLDPGNIASIEVLKDASAAAIYGARGANGVVLITTKSGKAGKTKISFDSSVMVSVVPENRFIDLMNTSDYGRFIINQQLYNNGFVNPTPGLFSVEANGENLIDLTAEEAQQIYDGVSTTDWQKEFYKIGLISNHTINASGGSNGNLFAVRGAFFHNTGTAVNSYYKRYNFNLNNQYKLSDKLKLKVILSPSYVQKVGAATGGGQSGAGINTRVMGSIIRMLSRQPNRGVGQEVVGDSNEADGIWLDPITSAQRTPGKTTSFGLIGNTMLSYEPMKGLILSIRGSGNYTNFTKKNYYPKDFGTGNKFNGIGRRFHYTNMNLNLQNLANYRFTLGAKNKHRFNAMAGYTYTSITNDSEMIESTSFDIETAGQDGLQYGTIPSRPGTLLKKKVMISYLGRLNYTLLNRYNFTYSYRDDSSSVFPKNQRDGFHSGAFAWNAHLEPFLKSVDNLSNLKLRFSYGQTGNAGIPYYESQATLGDAFPVIGDNLTTGVATGNLANENIKWESTDQYDAGFEIGLFDDRLNLTADVYYKKTNDMLLRKPLPISTGFDYILTNAGNIENKGLELALRTVNIDKGFKWETELNFAMNRNKVLSLGEGVTEQLFTDQYTNGQATGIMKVGESLGNWIGYQTEGVFTLADFEADQTTLTAEAAANYGSPVKNKNNIVPGDLRYVNTNGDDVVDNNDKTIIARTQPKHFGSLYNRFSYKGFELGLFFTYKYGVDVVNGNKHRMYKEGNKSFNRYALQNDAWTIDNPNGTEPRPNYYRNTSDFNFSDKFVEDGSFIRLQSINIAYNFPSKVVKKLGVESLKIYSNMDNIHIWTNYTGYDPEVSVARGQRAITSANLDYGAYPRTFNLSTGIRVGF